MPRSCILLERNYRGLGDTNRTNVSIGMNYCALYGLSNSIFTFELAYSKVQSQGLVHLDCEYLENIDRQSRNHY